jgi:signal recognition particle subunit SRP54
VNHSRRHQARALGEHRELDEAVVDEHALADPQVAEKAGVVDRQLGAAPRFAQVHPLPPTERSRLREDAQAEARSHQVEQHRHLAAELRRHPPHPTKSAAVTLDRSVREIESQDVRAGSEQRAQDLVVGAGGSEGGDDLGAALHGGRRIRDPIGFRVAMLEGLQERFGEVFRQLRGEARITQEDLAAALRQIRVALLEADVHFRVVKDFLARVEARAEGAGVLESLSPAQQVVAIVREELTATLGGEDATELRVDGAPGVVLLCGLQGSGKTTTAGKLAKRLAGRGRYPLLVAADLQRAAAVEQLVQVGRRVEIPVLEPEPGEGVVELGRRALRAARERGRDVVLIDTAGRLHVDAALMSELADLAAAVEPREILYVADAMTGQDAVRSAEEFARRLPLTGVLLTKLDGDARGGAALSVREVAKVPIRYVGVGEGPAELELFSPARLAARILGMGDVLALVERAQEAVDAKEARRLAERLGRNEFTLEDLRDQLRQMRKLGPLKSVLEMLPKGGALRGLDRVGEADERRLLRIGAIIDSMTPAERRQPQLLNASRKRRIARGSGTSVQEINQLLKQYLQMKKMMKQVKGGWLRRAFGG